ncbi:hypothetical protein [Caudoviricetes sp.]|nr:hypothetical protein [Caudoviricetes sp.]
MTPELAAAEFIFAQLRNRSALTDLLANVDSWGAAIFPEELPEGDESVSADPLLPAVVFTQGEGRDDSPQGQRYVVALPFLVSCLAAGERFPHNIAAEVDAALHAQKGVVGGFAITVTRLGASVPIRGNTEKRRYRAVAARYLVGLSPST